VKRLNCFRPAWSFALVAAGFQSRFQGVSFTLLTYASVTSIVGFVFGGGAR